MCNFNSLKKNKIRHFNVQLKFIEKNYKIEIKVSNLISFRAIKMDIFMSNLHSLREIKMYITMSNFVS